MTATPDKPSSDRPDGPARRLARALLDAAEQQQVTDRLVEELDDLCAVMEELDAFEGLLLTETTDVDHRRELMQQLFERRRQRQFSAVARLGLMRDVARQVHLLTDQRAGNVEVILTTAVPLTADQQTGVRKRLAELLDRGVILQVDVDPAVIGGARIRIGDSVFDASVAARLRRLRDQLARSIARTAGGPA